MLFGQQVGVVAGAIGVIGEVEQSPNGLHREAELSCVLDECQSLGRLGAIDPPVVQRAVGLGQQADLFVEPDRRNLDPAGLGQGADGKFHGFLPLIQDFGLLL